MQHLRRLRKKQIESAFAYHQSVMGLIGSMTVTWAGIDLILNTVIEWHQMQPGPKLARLPRDVTRKLDYLKDRLEKDVRISASDRERVRSFRIRLVCLNKFRKKVVHGQLYQANRRTLDWSVHLVRDTGLKLDRKTISLTNDEIMEGVREIADVAHEMSPFFAGMVGIPYPAKRA